MIALNVTSSQGSEYIAQLVKQVLLSHVLPSSSQALSNGGPDGRYALTSLASGDFGFTSWGNQLANKGWIGTPLLSLISSVAFSLPPCLIFVFPIVPLNRFRTGYTHDCVPSF